MIAVAALSTAVAFADTGIVSSDIVGYQSLMTDAKPAPSLGATFVPVNGASVYTLSTLRATDMDPDTDCFQLLDPDTTAATAYYSYFSKELADALAEDDGEPEGAYDDLVGWWDVGMAGEPENYRGDDEIAVGQGFLGLFASGADVALTCPGKVPLESTSISTDAKPAPSICNYLPVTNLKLKNLTAENMDPDTDSLQVLDPDTTAATAYYSYFSKELADALAEDDGEPEGAYDDLVGWWDVGMAGEVENYRGEENVAAGAMFLGLFASGEDVTINFPGSLNIVE